VFPNPFTPIGVEFDLEGEALVSLEIVDNAGNAVASPVHRRQMSAGHHLIEAAFPAGSTAAFAYRLTVDDGGTEITETKTIRGAHPQ
jgi:hypothetical protein